MECLDAFLDHAFVTLAIHNKNSCPYALCGNRFYHRKETVRGQLMKAMYGDYHKGTWVLHGVQSSIDYDNDNNRIDDEFVYENDESFKHTTKKVTSLHI